MSVDLPEPFSPTRPWISPAPSRSETTFTAATPAKRVIRPTGSHTAPSAPVHLLVPCDGPPAASRALAGRTASLRAAPPSRLGGGSVGRGGVRPEWSRAGFG